MKVITIAQHKGGVGKTVSALGIGHALAQDGHRVLLIDGDPQSNLSSTFPLLGPLSLCHLLRREASLADVVQQVGENLCLAASTKELSPLERMVGADVTHPYLLRKHLATVAEQFDYTIIDTPPAMGPMTVMALTAADYVLAPMDPDPFAFAGFHKLLEMLDAVRETFNPTVELKGVFLTRYHASYRGRVYHDFAEALKEQPRAQAVLMQTTIRKNAKLVEAVAEKQSIHTYAPESTSAQDYRALTAELLTRIVQ